MVIKKVLELGKDEFNLLIEAGKLLGSIRDSRVDFDEYSEQVKGILESLSNVIEECLADKPFETKSED